MAITMKDALQLMYRRSWFEQQKKALQLADADEVSAYYADPAVIENKMLILHDDEFALLEKLIREETVIPSRNNYRCAEILAVNELACIMNPDMELGSIKEVRDVFLSLNREDFDPLRIKVSWLNDCLRMIPFLYGILPVHDLCDLYRKRKGFDDTNEEIMLRLFRRIPESPVIVDKNEFYTPGLNDAGNEAKLRQLHKGLRVTLPPYSEIKDIIENGYPARSAAYKKLRQFLIRELKQDPSYADALLDAVYNYIAKGNTYRDIRELFYQEDIDMSDSQEKILKICLGNCWDDTGMLMLRGGKPGVIMPNHREIFYGGEGNG